MKTTKSVTFCILFFYDFLLLDPKKDAHWKGGSKCYASYKNERFFE